MVFFRVMVLAWGLLLLGACQARPMAADYVKPSIAVLKFENRAPFPYKWDIGGGTKDILVDRLMKTQRYQVIERPEINALMREINLQNSGVTRAQDRARIGQLKNVQYLVKGTITDFSHVAGGQVYAGKSSWRIGGSTNVAVMSMTLYVIQVESGQIIASERIQETVSAASVDVRGTYKNITFGGGVFYKTPLGQATMRAMDRAVEKITVTIASRPWVPKIAAVQAERKVIINGGKDRGLKLGEQMELVENGAPIIDPDTGDMIGEHPGKLLGWVRLIEVQEQYAVGEVTTLPGVKEVGVGTPCRRGKGN